MRRALVWGGEERRKQRLWTLNLITGEVSAAAPLLQSLTSSSLRPSLITQHARCKVHNLFAPHLAESRPDSSLRGSRQHSTRQQCGWEAGAPVSKMLGFVSFKRSPLGSSLRSSLQHRTVCQPPDSTNTSFTNIYNQKSHDGRPRKAPSTLFQALCNGYSAIFWSIS